MLGYPWWVLFFFVLGVIALGGAILTLFFAFGDRPADITATAAPEVTSSDFLLGVAGTVHVPVVAGGSARLLDNGDTYFPAMLEAIGRAEHSVNFMAYIWEPGEVSDRFFDALTERARAGVEVRLMLDAVGGLRTPRERLAEFEAAGGKVCWFGPLRFGKILRFYKRNHRRAIVIDGRVGYTGGAAVGDKWMGDARTPDEWRDSMVEVHGPIARGLQSAFTDLWSGACGEILVGPAFYPSDPDSAGTDGEEIAYHVGIVSTPSSATQSLRKAYWLSFRAARERIYLTSPYFVPDENTREVIMERARAGVDVRVLLPSKHTDARPIRRASHGYFEELLAAGVRIYEYQPTFLHAKLLVVDGVWSVVGSANMDIRSKELNQENVLGILDRGFASELEESFLRDLERAREVRLEEWRRRGVWDRTLERFFGLFVEQF